MKWVLKMNNQIVNTSIETVSDQIVLKSVEEFRQYARKTAESVVEMGRIVYETKQQLKKDKAAYEDFCSRIGYQSKSKSIVKLGQIGKVYTILKNHVELLPNNWTTLYEIARMGEQKIADFIEQGLIRQNMLGSEIKLLVSGKAQEKESEERGVSGEKAEMVPNGTLHGYQFVCELDDVNDVALKSQLKMILKNLSDMKVKVKISSELKSALNPELLQAA